LIPKVIPIRCVALSAIMGRNDLAATRLVAVPSSRFTADDQHAGG
jgi:hypothetical protein